MRHVFTAAFFLSLTACAPSFQTYQDPRTITGVDPVFDHYVTAYKTYKGRGLDYDIPIQFADLNGNTVGLCTRWSSGYRQIQIDKSFWSYASETQKTNLLFHELGHCDLNLNHNETKDSNGWPISFMYPYVFGYPYEMQGYYFAQLFNPAVAHTTASSLASHSECVHDIEVETLSE